MNSFARHLRPVSIAAFAVLAGLSFTNAREESTLAGSIHPKAHPSVTAQLTHAKVSFETALRAALAHQSGSAIKGELEVEDGSLVYSFDIVTAAGDVAEVEIDAGTAAILGSEIEKAGELEDHEDSKKCSKCCGDEEDDDDEKEEKHE